MSIEGGEWRGQTCEEALAAIQVSNNGGSEQSGGSVSSEKWSDSGSLLELEQMGLTQDLVGGRQWMKETGDSEQFKGFGLNSWKNSGTI